MMPPSSDNDTPVLPRSPVMPSLSPMAPLHHGYTDSTSDSTVYHTESHNDTDTTYRPQATSPILPTTAAQLMQPAAEHHQLQCTILPCWMKLSHIPSSPTTTQPHTFITITRHPTIMAKTTKNSSTQLHKPKHDPRTTSIGPHFHHYLPNTHVVLSSNYCTTPLNDDNTRPTQPCINESRDDPRL